MATSTYYASIAVVELHPGDLVTIESISVTEGECVLSGAWGFNISEEENISNVLSGKMIVPLGEKKELGKLPIKSEMIFLDSVPFLIDALVAPEFYNWPDSINFNESADYLESIGKMATPSGTPDNFKKTLSAARLVKHLVDMWQLDEQERNNRKYVEGEDAKITILPESWLEATSTNRS